MEAGHTGPRGKHVTSHVVEATVHVFVHVHTLLPQAAEQIVRGLGTIPGVATRARVQVCGLMLLIYLSMKQYQYQE